MMPRMFKRADLATDETRMKHGNCPHLIRGSIRVAQNKSGGSRKMIDHRGSIQMFGRLPLHAGSVAGPYQQAPLDARVPSALQVNQLVPNHVALRQVEAELVSGVEEKLRRWLAAAARRIGSF